MRKADGTLSDNSQFVWSDVPVGGGGYITNIVINQTTGEMFAGTDVDNAYVRAPGDEKWRPLFKTTSVTNVADYEPIYGGGWCGNLSDGYATHYFSWSKSNPNRAYTAANSWVFTVTRDPAKPLSDPASLTMTRWNLTGAFYALTGTTGGKRMRTGWGLQRWFGQIRLSVHPTNPDIAIFASTNDGVHYTLDAGANCSTITLPSATGQPHDTINTPNFAVFDQGDGNYVYAHVSGRGLYRSSTGVAGTFSLVTGAPVGCTSLFSEADGTLWITGDERVTQLVNLEFVGTTGWTAGNSATLSASGNILTVTNGAASQGYAYQALSVTSGMLYRLSIGTTTSSSGNNIMRIGTAPGLADIASISSANGTTTGTFIAASTGTVYVSLMTGSSVSGQEAKFGTPIVSTPGLYKLARGAATAAVRVPNNIADAENYWPFHFAVDPHNANRIITSREQVVQVSTNRGSTWTNVSYAIPGDSPEHECYWRRGGSPKMGGGIHFDPLVANRVWIGEGFGVYRSEFVGTSMSLIDVSAGIEEKIHNSITVNHRTGKVGISAYDTPFVPVDFLDRYDNVPVRGTSGDFKVQPGSYNDYAIDDDNFWVATMFIDPVGCPSYSTDNGRTFTKYPGTTPVVAGVPNPSGHPTGCIAVSNKNNVVIAGANRAVPIYTKDGGATWNFVSLNGSTDYFTNHAYNFYMRKTLASDKERPGVFAMVVCTMNTGNSSYTNPLGGLWVTTDGGDNWVQKQQGVVGFNGQSSGWVQANTIWDFRQYYMCQLHYIPGFSGELFYTSGDDMPFPLFHSTNDGEYFERLGAAVNLNTVRGISYSQNLPGAARPAVNFWGYVNNVLAHWITFDWFETFIQVDGKYPMDNLTGVRGVGGDMTTFGRLYTARGGSGSQFSTYRDIARAI